MNCRASPEFIVVVLNFVYFFVKVALLRAAFFILKFVLNLKEDSCF